jgi:D-alanine transaminase
MSRVSYVNGRYVPHAQARVHVEDRGYQFADGVYEVCAVRGGELIDEAPHMKRLERSLGELKIKPPMGMAQLAHVMRETVRRNRVRDGLVYLQITRGVARRDHPFPSVPVKASLVVTARNLAVERNDAWAERGVKAILVPETRWARCDIKSTALLANVLAKQQAREAGAFEAWFVDRDGSVTEGASTNAWIVDADGVLRTRRLDHAILPGVTRGEIIPLCRQAGVTFEEAAFTAEAVKTAREAFISAASIGVLPVTVIDGRPVGDGKPGPVAKALRQAYWASRQG